MNVRRVTTLGVGLAMGLAACSETDRSFPLPPSLDAEVRQTITQWGVVPIGPTPPQATALVALGRALFFDRELSGNRDIACGTCHNAPGHLGDGLSLAIGTGGTGLGPTRTLGAGRQFVPRNAPSLLNAGLGLFYLFWDGRVSGTPQGGFTTPAGAALPAGLPTLLAAQAMFPVTNRVEMRGEPGDTDVFGRPNELARFGDSQFPEIWAAVQQRLMAIPAYDTMFAEAYPGVSPGQLTFRHAAAAIAAFETAEFTRTDSPFDRFLRGEDGAMSVAAKQGALLFFGDARCSMCHNGPLLNGSGQFAATGAPQLGPGTGGGAPLDYGRGDLDSFARFFFRTPQLRNVELTAPYFHDGAYASLEAVVRHYNDVPLALQTFDVSQLAPALQGTYHGDPATVNATLEQLDSRVSQPLNLTAGQQAQLVAFLRSLTDPAARDLSGLVPPRVPSGLPLP
jgi:cytochrome c peroxidase